MFFFNFRTFIKSIQYNSQKIILFRNILFYMKEIKILVSVENLTEETVEWINNLNVGVEFDFFSIPENLHVSNLENSIKKYSELLKKVKNKITMHGAFSDLNISAREPMIVDVCKFRISQSIEIAEKLNIHDIVFHPNYFHSNRNGYKDFWTKLQTDFWANFVKTIENKNITIYLENTREENASYISSIIESVDSKYIKACYDTGHSNCFTNSKIKPSEWVKSYNNKLGLIHLHSNYGIVDDHTFFRNGTVDFTDFFEQLSYLQQLPIIVAEVKTKEDAELSIAELRKIFSE